MENLLKNKGLKITKARLEVLKILKKAKNPMPVEDIYLKMTKGSCKSLATCYRVANQLTEVGILNKTLLQNGIYYFEMSGENHKHYIVCSNCGKIVPTNHCPLEEFESEVEGTTGFKVTGHKIELIGICPECQKN